MPTAKVNGLDIYYEERKTTGSKDPLLMIMGFTFSLLDWGDDLPKALSNNYHVIMFDNRASGRTTPSITPEFTISDMAADAAGLLAALKISRSHVFGVSMGGMIAQELALRYPAVVHKLILGCTACSIKTLSSSGSSAFSAFGSGDPTATWSLLFSRDFIDKYKTTLAAFWKNAELNHSKGFAVDLQLGALTKHDTCDRLTKIAAETLILTGDKDRVIDPSNSDKLSEIPGSKLIKGGPFTGALHGFPYSHWKETAMEITNFLK